MKITVEHAGGPEDLARAKKEEERINAPFDEGEFDDELILADGLEPAFIGLVYRFGMIEPIACYDIDVVLDIYVRRDGMTIDDAQEFFEFNTIGAWVGDRTPCFIKRGTLP